jgi:hypothetical protein
MTRLGLRRKEGNQVAVHGGRAAPDGESAEDRAEEKAEDRGRGEESDCPRQGMGDDVDRPARIVGDGIAEIEAERVAKISEVLLEQRLIEAELGIV